MSVERLCPMCRKPTKRPILNWIDGEIPNTKLMRGCNFCYMKWKAEKLKINEPNDDPDDIL